MIERELAGGESHEYSLPPMAGEFVRVIVEHAELMPFSLKAPMASCYLKSAALGGPNQKRLSLVAELGGEYIPAVHPVRKDKTRVYVLKAQEGDMQKRSTGA